MTDFQPTANKVVEEYKGHVKEYLDITTRDHHGFIPVECPTGKEIAAVLIPKGTGVLTQGAVDNNGVTFGFEPWSFGLHQFPSKYMKCRRLMGDINSPSDDKVRSGSFYQKRYFAQQFLDHLDDDSGEE